ncbi:MAG: putative Dynein beta chain [Streblomastix strix]|uniref:Putative Dynein beta chain n=1 Tax=Streblomastix strix TaxID=222440 RepID=A0A5J4WLN7_9EUKA|nr:MAG: putative Dynein beta chain [Streblomastix strix]
MEVEGIVLDSIMTVEQLQSQYKAVDFLLVEDVQLTFKKFFKDGLQIQVHLQKSMRQVSMANLGTNFFGDKKAEEVPDKGAKKMINQKEGKQERLLMLIQQLLKVDRKIIRRLLNQKRYYDWGLRAIKSALVVAGLLKRADPDFPEETILMRVIRNFNLPKIATEDVEVIMGFIDDLFPKTSVHRKVNRQLESSIHKVTLQSKLIADETFILKVVQLLELLDFSHSIFFIGPPGSSKTQVWRITKRNY